MLAKICIHIFITWKICTNKSMQPPVISSRHC